MPNMPKISVVIATFNRRDTLLVTLKRLASQSFDPKDYEVLVVDDGSTDSTSAMVETLKPSLPYALKYLFHENTGPGYTQNRGIREAASGLVLLLPDDVWATPDLLSRHVMMHSGSPGENIAVLGRVVQSPDLPATVMHRHWDPFRFDRFAGMREVGSVNFLACNISVKRGFLLDNGMYLEKKGASHEDIELGYRLGRRGLRILFDENALAYHHHAETLAGACARAYERGLSMDLLTDNIPKDYILPLYNICSTEAGLRAFLRMLPREAVRRVVFNRWTVRGFWLPVLRLAETSRLAALFASMAAYRGAVYYHMREGYRDSRNRKKAVALGHGTGVNIC